jgi:transposase
MDKRKINRLLATNDFKSLSKIEKAVKLITQHDVSQRTVAKHLHLGRKQIRLAYKAHQEGREIAKKGRPALLNKKNTNDLLNWVGSKADQATPVNYKQFQDKVCVFIV